MRLGVLDVGSNTVHLLVVDAHPGAHPWPATSHKEALRLAEHLDAAGAVDDGGVEQLCRFVAEAVEVAEDHGATDMLAFATSAVREATNGDAVLAEVRRRTGVALQVLPGDDEARLTFLAARRWLGWSAGRLQLLDIGGGSLELASGIDEEPDVAFSLQLGAGRLTRAHLRHDPPKPGEVKDLRRLVRAEIAAVARPLLKAGPPDLAVGTSKTFRSLARVTGAAPSSEGLYVRRSLRRDALAERLPRLAEMSAAERARLPGVSPARSRQLLAGAVVADAAMELLGLEELQICPWALREGIILRRIDGLTGGA
ncbi:MAG: Ppx/GppA family phosphatase [Actinomycetes bacterium]